MCRPFGEAWVGEVWVGEACTCRLAPGTTWVDHQKAFPVRALSDPRSGDAWGRSRSHRVGVAVTLGRVAPFSPVDPDFPRFYGARADGGCGDAAMVAQLGREPLVSPPARNFGTGAAAVSSRRLAPRNVRSNGVTRLSSAGARVTNPGVGSLWQWHSDPPVPLSFSPPSAGTTRMSW